MNELGAKVMKREEQLRNLRYNHEQQWQKLAPLISPSRYGITTKIAEGQNTQLDIFWGKPRHAADMAANFVSSEMFNPSELWFDLAHTDPELRKDDEVKEWCEEMRDIQMAELGRAGFYGEMSSAMVDIIGFGQGHVSYFETPQPQNREPIVGFRGTRIECSKIGRFLIARDENGQVDTSYCDFLYTAHQICARWPEKDLPREIKDVKEKEPDKQFRMVRAIEPRPYNERGYGNKRMPWRVCYVIADLRHCVEESGLEYFPVIAPEWDRIPEETYGRGRGELALHDAQTGNAAVKYSLDDHAMSIAPPIAVRHDSVFGTLRRVPGGIMPFRTHGQRLQDVVMPWQSGSRPDVHAIEMDRLEKAVQEAFFVDVLIQFMQMDLKDVNNYTYAQKMSLLFKILGPAYGRLERQGMRAFIDGHLEFLGRKGQLPPPPPQVVEYAMRMGHDKIELDVEFNNPLARAQKRGEVEAISNYFAANALQIELDMKLRGHSVWLDRIDEKKASLQSAQIHGVPASITRSDDEIDALTAERQKQQEQAQAAEEAMMVAEGIGKVAPALKAMQPQGSA